MFKESFNSMRRSIIKNTVEQCSKLVGEKFRLFYNDGDDKFTSKTIG